MVPLHGGQVGEIVEDLDRGIRVGLPEADPSAQCRGDLHVGNAIFFVLLLSLITLLDDRYRPVHEVRFAPPSVG